MSAEQRADYDRLIIDIAASKTEIAALRERILATADNKVCGPSVHCSEGVLFEKNVTLMSILLSLYSLQKPRVRRIHKNV